MSGVAFLDSSVAACWRDGLIGSGAVQRRHWRTKVAHYQAVLELLEDGTPPRWEAVVARVQPKGSRSTFYDVTGASATHPLMAEYEADRGPGSNGSQIALAYRRGSAVDQLIDETKVWSFWSYREEWLIPWRDKGEVDRGSLADSLESIMRAWARDNPALARALDLAPPACAVEDLTLIHGQLPALRARLSLRAVLREAVDGPPEHIGDAAPKLAALIPAQRSSGTDELLLGLAESFPVSDRLPSLSTA